MGWADSNYTWAGPVGTWAEDIPYTNNVFTNVYYISNVLNIGEAGRFAVLTPLPAFAGVELEISSGTFVKNWGYYQDLAITGLEGTLGSFVKNALDYNLAIVGYTSSSGTFAKDHLIGSLVILPLYSEYTGYDCLVMCLENAANTVYDNFVVNAMADFDGTILLALSDGLYTFSGSDDEGTDIVSLMRTTDDDFGSSSIKSVPYCYLNVKGGTATVKRVLDGTVGPSISISDTGGNWRNRKVKLGKGNKKRHVAIQIENVSGSSLKIKDIELYVKEILGKKVME